MDLEEKEGVDQLRKRCQSCGTELTEEELALAVEGDNEALLCSRCALEQVPGTEEPDET
jgi:hypothetical protein